MGHHHHHAHSHGAAVRSLNGIFVFSIVLNLLFVVIEAGVGFYTGALSLLSDAGHNLSDVFSLVLVLVSLKLAAVHSTRRFSYGLKKSTILVSLLNAIILLVAVGAIIIESLRKFGEPAAVDGAAVSWTAFAGILINGATALLLMRDSRQDINVRGAFLHMAADTLVSLGVVVSGIVISCTGYYVIDPIVSLLIAAVILVSTWRILTESLRLSLDGTPEGIEPEKIEKLIGETAHVTGVHHLHIWAISTTANALTAHVLIDDLNAMESVKHDIKHKLAHAGIGHSTLEFETSGCECPEKGCCH